MRRLAIINVNLQYEIPKGVVTEEQIKEFVENIELPPQYIEDSFEFVKVWVEE